MIPTRKAAVLVGVVLLCAFASYNFLQVVPVSAVAGSTFTVYGTASPVGNAHSHGTAWLHDPAGGSIGLPE